MQQNFEALFQTYFNLGLEHISDFGGYDHMLYLLTLTVAFSFWQWKKVLLAVTGFTVGHSIALALAVYGVSNIKSSYIEFAIPITIFISAVFMAFRSQSTELTKFTSFQLILTIAFGLVHGAGFSGYLSSMLSNSEHLGMALFGFNIGLEVGQILIVLVILFINLLIENIFNIKKSQWVLFSMGGAASLSLALIFENKIW